MLRLAVAVLLAVTISAAGVAQARMNVDADLCQPRSRDKPDLTHQLRVQTEWLEKVEGLARANALLGRARTYFAMADWDRAIGDFTRAEQEFEHSGYPKSNFIGSSVQSSLLVARGKAYRRKGDDAEAIKDFDSALALPARLMDPTSSEWTEAHIERGLAYRQMGRYDRAIEDFDRIIHVNPGSLQMARAFGLRSAVRLEKGEGATNDLYSALALSYGHCAELSDNLCWLGVLGDKWRNQDERDTLREYWWGQLMNECSPLVNDRPNLRDSRALALLQLGELSRARSDSEAAVQADPNDGEKHYTLAMILEAGGDKAGADREFAEARRLALGDWERWQRQQGRFRGQPLPVALPARARRVIEETFVALEKAFVDHPATLKRPDLRKPPVRVAALVFDDERIGAPGYCRSRVVKSLEEDVAHLNHAIGRTLYVMSEPSDSDLLIVIGGPQSVPNLKIDAKAEAIFRAGERRLTVPHREHWQSYLPPDVEPYEAAALYYREDNGELLYGLISRSWSTITKECAGRFADDLARALTTDVNRSLPTDFGAPQSWYPAASAIELCFLAMKPDAATDDRVACVERVVELLKRRD